MHEPIVQETESCTNQKRNVQNAIMHKHLKEQKNLNVQHHIQPETFKQSAVLNLIEPKTFKCAALHEP